MRTERKGIVLAGGKGTRLRPLTAAINKHLLPVYDKPMIYNPIGLLMLAGIRDILLITGPESIDAFRRLLGDGTQWGIRLDYAIQPEAGGIAQAFAIGRDFLAGSPVSLALGDNIFHGNKVVEDLTRASARDDRATVFAYWVRDARPFGVVELDDDGRPAAIVEKPANPKSNWALTGLYFFPGDVVERSANLRPSARGELEITDVIRPYMDEARLDVEVMRRGIAWLDTGSFQDLHSAASYLEIIERRTGLKVNCPEEIALRCGYIDRADLARSVAALPNNEYRQYLAELGELPAVRR